VQRFDPLDSQPLLVDFDGQPWLEWCLDLVDTIMTFQDYNQRTQAQIIKDLNAAHDKIKAMEKSLGRREAKIQELTIKLRHGYLIRWALTAAVLVLWEFFKLLLKHC